MKRNSIGLFIASLVLFVVSMANLSPVLSGDLTPPSEAFDQYGDPAPTTQELPSWSKKIPPSERIVRVLNDAAVLDRQTGLVFQYTPYSIHSGLEYSWYDAKKLCWDAGSGGVLGWHLMTYEEMRSFYHFEILGAIDPAIQGNDFWLSTTHVSDPSAAYVVEVPTGTGTWTVISENKSAGQYGVWCVRGNFGRD